MRTLVTGNWFECKVSLNRQIDGKDLPLKVTETYLVDALTFSEAESRIIDEVLSYVPFPNMQEVLAVKHVRYSELFLGDSDNGNEDYSKFYKVKAVFSIFDEKSATEKKTSVFYLVEAKNIEDAMKRFKDGMQGTMGDYETVAITETPILEVFLCKETDK